jgi:hypothetical protein
VVRQRLIAIIVAVLDARQAGMEETQMMQPLPIKTERSVAVAPLVIEDIQRRIEQGVRTYGQPLHTFNGRSALQDAYEEALDLPVYLKQRLIEEEGA